MNKISGLRSFSLLKINTTTTFIILMTMMITRRNVEREVEIMNVLKSQKLLQLYEAYDNGRSEMCLITE